MPVRAVRAARGMAAAQAGRAPASVRLPYGRPIRVPAAARPGDALALHRSRSGRDTTAEQDHHDASRPPADDQRPAETTAATGDQWVIGHGHQRAVVTEVGATLRSFTVADGP